MRRHEILQMAIYKRDQAARFRKIWRGSSSANERETLAAYIAILEREANQLEIEAALMNVSVS